MACIDDNPELVFWKKELSSTDGSEWQPLLGHDCNGFAIGYFVGYVIRLVPAKAAMPLLNEIAAEKFCAGVLQEELSLGNADSLDYGTEEPHRRAYVAFLEERGLEAGSLELLQQAVYPLAATYSNLDVLGIRGRTIPAGVALVILGWNCD